MAWIYRTVNNRVYRCGFTGSQQKYEDSCRQLFDALDRLYGTSPGPPADGDPEQVPVDHTPAGARA